MNQTDYTRRAAQWEANQVAADAAAPYRTGTNAQFTAAFNTAYDFYCRAAQSGGYAWYARNQAIDAGHKAAQAST